MKRRLLSALMPLMLLFTAASCGKKEEEPTLQRARQTELESFSQGVTPPPKPVPLPPNQVIEVPAYVKGKYSVVTLGIGNRKTMEVKKFEVRIGESARVPGTDYTIKVHTYLPNWVLKGNVVTSREGKMDDPVIRATVLEGDRKVFDGFIFMKNKTPSFMTDKWVIGLMGAS